MITPRSRARWSRRFADSDGDEDRDQGSGIGDPGALRSARTVDGRTGDLERRIKINLLICRGLHADAPYGTLIAVRDEKDGLLSKDDLIDMQGTVVAVHSGGLYRVQCDAGHEVLAQLSGRMRRFRIKVVPGDRVTVGVSPYDPVRGIITFRAR